MTCPQPLGCFISCHLPSQVAGVAKEMTQKFKFAVSFLPCLCCSFQEGFPCLSSLPSPLPIFREVKSHLLAGG